MQAIYQMEHTPSQARHQIRKTRANADASHRGRYGRITSGAGSGGLCQPFLAGHRLQAVPSYENMTTRRRKQDGHAEQAGQHCRSVGPDNVLESEAWNGIQQVDIKRDVTSDLVQLVLSSRKRTVTAATGPTETTHPHIA